MSVQTRDHRLKLLEQWAVNMAHAAAAGALTGGKPLTIRALETVRGPRAGALEIDAGLDAGKLLRILTADDCALHRQFVPWSFTGDPRCIWPGVACAWKPVGRMRWPKKTSP